MSQLFRGEETYFFSCLLSLVEWHVCLLLGYIILFPVLPIVELIIVPQKLKEET